MKKNIQKIQEALARKGVANFEIYIKKSQGTSLEVLNQEIETLETQSDFGFGIRVNIGGAIGFSYGTDLSDANLALLIDQVVAMAPYTDVDAQMNWVAPHSTYPEPQIFDEQFSTLTLSEKVGLAKLMEVTAQKVDTRISAVRYCSYRDSLDEVAIANSLGLNVVQKSTNFSLTLMPVAIDNDESESSFQNSHSPFFKDLSPESLARFAAHEALSLLGGRRISSYKGPVLLSQKLVADILGILAPSCFADTIAKQNSFWCGKLGKKLYSENVTFIDDGLYPKGVMTAPFDDEGRAKQTTLVVDRGVVKQFLYDQTWACREGKESTGNAVRLSSLSKPSIASNNFYLKPGEASFSELLKNMNEGLLINDAIGMHTADPVSGDFSVGIQGFLVRGGQLSAPFKSVALTGNLHEIFSSVLAIGNDLKFFGELGAPSVLISGGSVSGE